MGRYLDLVGEPDNPLQGLSLDYSLAPALATASMPVAAVSSPADYTMWAYGLGEPISAPALETFGALGALAGPFARLRAGARRLLRHEPRARRDGQLRRSPRRNPATIRPSTYPAGEFAERLAALAAMLHTRHADQMRLAERGRLLRHARERGRHARARTSNRRSPALVAFQRDLEARGLDQRVLIQLWSEFGRRPQENGSGTDHGAGGVAFLIGTRAAGKMVGEFPGLSKLDENENVVRTSDFRSMYCSLLEQWFQTEAGLVIPEAASFERPVLVA